ncbi:MAG: DNA polymerase III subunit beta [Gammaproteobacteria bacterium RIFCSPHIGHO2_12_FULL_35_23]|nr:MAG: DNA polymerase III subunit beta [Gammaproteobacteria bacterium RIFCSPHIGHO2_12_FULL_35_23]
MKITLERNSLLAALQLVAGAVEKRQTLPILSHVLLSFEKNILAITATDLEVELLAKIQLPLTVEKCEFTVPARKLIDICRELPEDVALKFEVENNKLTIRSGSGKFVLSTLQAAEFPKVGKSEVHLEFNIDQSILKYLLGKTYFTMAQQDVRYYLNGMLFDLKKDSLQVVAADGHRLALAAYKAAFGFKNDLQIILPRKGALELMRLLNDETSDIKIAIGTNHIHAITNQFVFTSKLVEGKFPDFKRVIPKNPDKIATITRNLFKEALSRTAILCNEKYHGVRLIFEQNLLSIFANNSEQEEAEEKITINYTNEKLDIGFNVTYLLDALTALPEGDIKLSLTDANSSVLIEHSAVKDCLYVIMPMRL